GPRCTTFPRRSLKCCESRDSLRRSSRPDPAVGDVMREIVFDTETTGLDPLQGDRLVEIGCMELVNRFPTGKTFPTNFNPEPAMPEQAFKIHGLSREFFNGKPLFVHKVEELIVFLGDAQLV